LLKEALEKFEAEKDDDKDENESDDDDEKKVDETDDDEENESTDDEEETKEQAEKEDANDDEKDEKDEKEDEESKESEIEREEREWKERHGPPGYGKITPMDAGGLLIANASRTGIETWLDRKLDVFVPTQYVTWLDPDREMNYFLKIRISNDFPTAENASIEYHNATKALRLLNENSTEVENKTAEENLESAQKLFATALTEDKNQYIHVRVLYDPSGAIVGESGSDGIAKVGKKALKGLQVRGLLESKAAADVLEYFDENIVPVPKRVTRALTVKLNVTAVDFGIAGVDSELFEEYTKTLESLDKADAVRRETADLKNSLESYVYEMKEKLTDDTVITVTTEEIRESFLTALTEAGDWLYGDGESALLKDYKDKIADLKKVGDPILNKAKELTEVPELVEKMREFAAEATDILSDLPQKFEVTQEEADGAQELVKKALEWLDETETKQAGLAATDDRVLSVKSIEDAFSKLQRRMRSLLKRKKKRKPKKPKAKKGDEKKSDDEKKDDEEKK